RVVLAEAGYGPELGQPAIREGHPLIATGGRSVGPAIVVGVLAPRGGEGRLEPEQLVDECRSAAGEVGHGPGVYGRDESHGGHAPNTMRRGRHRPRSNP